MMNLHQLKMNSITILIFVISLSKLQAQDVIPASGGEATGSGGSASYSVGQIVSTVNTGTNGFVGQGVQQPFEISLVSGIKEKFEISLTMAIYPIPATDYMTLRVENFDKENLTYKLLDITGKLLVNKKITSNETNINMSQLIPATYFLYINQDTKEVKIFKIIKN